MATKTITKFRVGDIVKNKKNRRYVVSGVRSWVHGKAVTNEGVECRWISLCREMGETTLLTHDIEYTLVTPREKVGKKWWTIFPDGEK